MADRAKGIFISNISHELRSPLHGILASAEFLADTRLDTLQRTFIDTIDSCGRTLLEVINHVLDFGKLTYIARLKNKVARPQIERSTSNDVIPQQINVTPADLMAVTEQVAESCYAGYEFKGLFGQVDIGSILDDSKPTNNVSRPRKKGGYGRAKDPTSALTLIIDVEYREQGWFFLLQSGAVQRILMNITGNALKYTSAGWVRVHLTSTESDGHTTVHLTVSDSGKGISSEFLRTRLFSPFSQEDTLQTGTGLGMSIVKQVVDRLGGQINVQSQVGLGSQVNVSLPADAVDRDTDDSCTRVRARSNGLKAFLAGFDKNVPASRLLYESMATYLTKWYDIDLVEDVHSSDLIISDECPELLDYFQQTSPADRSAFSPPFCTSPTALSPDLFAVSTPESFHNVYRAWQPLIVLCSNALRYELYGQQAESGKIIDFSSKPCGPYKLARSILFCLDQAETRRKSLEAEMEQTHISSPLIHSETSNSTSTSVDDIPDSGPPTYPRRGSFGRGVVRFSPTVRRGSSDLGASMYVAGRGFVPTLTSSIVEPQRFVGMRRKSAIASPQVTPSSEGDINFNVETRHHIPHPKHTESEQIAFKMPRYPRSPSSKSSVTPPRAQTPSPSVAPKNTSVPVSPTTDTELSTPRPPSVLIVEDNSVNALILATFLRKRGYPFVQAGNGLLAVQAVQSRPEGFDVILMDIQSIAPFAILI
jgi:signal transduction histidine kinase